MTYLLDVNALLALGHAGHVFHDRTEAWVTKLRPSDRLATCAITELGFVRIAPQARLSPDVAASKRHLATLKRAQRPPWILLSDGLDSESLPPWVVGPSQTTDGHLVVLASAHRALLATLDEGMPGAVIIAG